MIQRDSNRFVKLLGRHNIYVHIDSAAVPSGKGLFRFGVETTKFSQQAGMLCPTPH
jgi:hypothetical protein